jgi:hypothetical protein
VPSLSASIGLDFDRVIARLDALPLEICQQAAEVIREELLKAATADTGGDLRLSRVPWMNFTLDVSVNFAGTGAQREALLRPAPIFGGAAVWSWLEYGTRPHAVGVGRGATWPRKRMLINGNWKTGPTRATVHMPAKLTWTRGVEAGQPRAIELAQTLFQEALNG